MIAPDRYKRSVCFEERTERVSDCCLTPSEPFCQLYHCKNMQNFNEMMIYDLYQTNMHSWIFIVQDLNF